MHSMIVCSRLSMVDDIILHDHLREAIVKTMEDPDSPIE